MNPGKSEFVELCLANQALRFGEFTLKSNRLSPYFFNVGVFARGSQLSRLAQHYARVIVERVPYPFMLYGPAYKGIPLAAATALKLADDHGLDVAYAFNRKEAKGHGEGGSLIGAPLRGQVVIVDDVITAGTSIRQAVAAIRAADATPHCAVIALDRQEVADSGPGNHSATQQMEKEYGIPIHAIIALADLIDYLEQTDPTGGFTAAVRAYRERYGAS